MRLIALKRLRYPRGEGGVEYQPGDTFETQTERDGQALLLVRLAEEPQKRAPKKTLTLKAPPAAIQTTSAAPAEITDQTAGTYGRRDMRASED